MEMTVHLHPEVFDIVNDGVKDVEIRVNDSKRRQLKVGDTLLFLKRPDDIERKRALITNLIYFDNFNDVCFYYSMERIYLKDTSKEEYINLMKKFYSDDEVNKYGVVAIEFKLLED